MRPAALRLLALPLLSAATAWATACSDNTGPGGAAELVFAVQPSSVGLGEGLSPPLTVAVRDPSGRTVLEWSDPITLSLEGGGPGAALQGTTSQPPLAGLAVFDDLKVSAVGAGYRLRAGSGSLEEGVSDPFEVHAVFRAASLSAGTSHTCALKEDGRAYCWGRNTEGALGTGDTDHRTAPAAVSTEVRFTSISAYENHTCGLSTEGAVYCWGDNPVGELGDGSREDRTVPTRVDLPGPALSVEIGWRHACALLEDHRAFCWGAGGALGIGTAEGVHSTPVQVTGDHDWALIDVGYLQSCGLTTSGVAYCWGPNSYGENGVGERNGEYYAPTPVLGGHRFRDLVAGGGPCHGETCGVTVEGTVLCWGKNYQRGTGSSSALSWLEPTALVGDPGFVRVMVGPAMVCGATPSGEILCLGDPQHGMLPYTHTPLPLVAGMDVASVALGQTQTCVLTTDGEAYCWGLNEYGQLGSVGSSIGFTSPRAVWAPAGG